MNAIAASADSELSKAFKCLRDARDVAKLLSVKYSSLTYYLYRRGIESNYREFSLNKRTGGERIILAPITPLKLMQKRLNYILQLIYKPKGCVHGFVENRSVVTNAVAHLKKDFVLNIDLNDFFPSINFGRVRGMFMAIPYEINEKAASVLAQICCAKGYLPQGAPTSPVVSNMICGKLDSQLLGLARKFKCSYSRYADDITFSTTANSFPAPLARISGSDGRILVELGRLLRSVIEGNGFSINESKTRIQRKGSRQEVTGLTVNESANVRRVYVRQIRAMLHAIEKFGIEDAEKEFHEKYYTKQRRNDQSNPPMLRVLKGRLEWIKMVKGESSPVFMRLYNKFCRVQGKPRKYIIDPIEDVPPAVWILESEDPPSQGSAFMLRDIGLVTCAHVLTDSLKAFRQDSFDKEYSINVISRNDDLDLAILDIESGEEVAVLEAGDSEIMGPGDKIMLFGFPNYRLGQSCSSHEGRITATRNINGQRCFLIDAPIVRGNSGGPVLDSSFKVVGIAATGADSVEDADTTEKHTVIPISSLEHLR